MKIEKVPHSICAQTTVMLLRPRLARIPKKNWDEFLSRVQQNIHRHWARKVLDKKPRAKSGGR